MLETKALLLNFISVVILVNYNNLTLSSNETLSPSSSSFSKDNSELTLPSKKGKEPENAQKKETEDTSIDEPNSTKSTTKNHTRESFLDKKIINFYDYLFPPSGTLSDANKPNSTNSSLQDTNQKEGAQWSLPQIQIQTGLEQKTLQIIKDGLTVRVDPETLAIFLNAIKKIDGFAPTIKETLDQIATLLNSTDNKAKAHTDRLEGLISNCANQTLAMQQITIHNICILFASIASTSSGIRLIYQNSKPIKIKSSETFSLVTGIALIAWGIAIPSSFLEGRSPTTQE